MNDKSPRQLLLEFRLDDSATLDNFVAGSGNRQLMHHLDTDVLWGDEQFTYIWAGKGAGKTHLLQALCQELTSHHHSPIYLPLADSRQFEPEMLSGLEQLDLVCLDDVDAVAGDAAWEQALFHLYNRVRSADTRLVIAADRPPAELPVRLADLQSRLQACVIFQIQEPADEDKAGLLIDRARKLGIVLAPAVVQYVLQRHERSIPALIRLLDELDRQSLEQKRRVTIPLVRGIMGW